jgi:hypothetical protein
MEAMSQSVTDIFLTLQADNKSDLLQQLREAINVREYGTRGPMPKGTYTVQIHFQGSRVPEPGEAPDGGGVYCEYDDE